MKKTIVSVLLISLLLSLSTVVFAMGDDNTYLDGSTPIQHGNR